MKKQTKSKLICHHIPAYQSWTSSFDKYGDCDETEAMKKIKAARDQLKDRPRDLQTEVRKYANTKKEAWSTGGIGSVFDNIRLGDLVTDIEMNEMQATETPYKEFFLDWTNELWNVGLKKVRKKGEFCPVKIVPLTENQRESNEKGYFRAYFNIPKDQQNYALRWGRDEYGNLLPPPKFLRVMGGDPTQYAAASEVIEGSNNAAMVFNMPDAIIDNRSKQVVTKVLEIEYFARPEMPDDAYEDFLKLIIFTGCLSIVEANMPYVATRLCEEGLYHYMLFKDENGFIVRWKPRMRLISDPEKTFKLIRTTGNQEGKEMVEIFVRLHKEYFKRPREGEKDYGKTIKSSRWLKQCMDLEIANTKLFDLFMAAGYSLLTMELYLNMLLGEAESQTSSESILEVMQALSM